MKSKILTAVAAALVAGVSGIAILGNTSPAEAKFKLNLSCYPYFQKLGNNYFYRCRRPFIPVCKKGMMPSKPVLKKVSKKAYIAEYSCIVKPK